ncbi:penicillin-binding protein 2 [Filimonas lacunae]|uniref:Penicillin-binding protein 2 n=1 Tax=Filimonas lacunae TaxID=477680 RepID=A0A1N7QQL7_9BACT|nr:penicillin-binding transpeptidase domain-containing protein [Filimonas lacunae]SIT24797.1 penicillin-binding protein 2 [Filimonas lacunae]
MKKITGVFILLQLLFVTASGQNYSFPITDLLPYVQHNQQDSVCALQVFPQRGTIYDRRGRVLASDSVLYDLMVRPGKVKRQDEAIICSILKITAKEYHDRLKYALNWSDPWHPNAKKTFDSPAPFKGLLSRDITASLLKRMAELQPAFTLEKRAVRRYPFNTAGHVLGYVKTGNTGETGLEESYDKVLRGVTGLQFFQCDHKSMPVKRWKGGTLDVLPERGRDVYTTIDIPLQQLGEKLMKGKRGSLVAIDPETGGILAMVSSPGYSPTELAMNRNTYYQALRNNRDRPFLNRTITSFNAPGSVFKLFQALIALQIGVIDPGTTLVCNGGFTLCGTPAKPKCHVTGWHKPDMVRALAISCNSYFADVYRKVIGLLPQSGLTAWAESVKLFGFGRLTGIDLPAEKAGVVPDTSLINKRYKAGWNRCTILSNAIGQGEVSTTVLQLANAINIIAGKGWYYPPHVADSIGGITNSGYLQRHTRIKAFDLPDSSWNRVHQGMYEAVQAKYGTAYSARINGLDICGKTGTVENGKGEKDHAVFAAFAPRAHPRIAIVCLVENGGFGATVAAPVVTQLISKYLGGR